MGNTDGFNVNVVKTTEDFVVVEIFCASAREVGERRRFSINELVGVIRRSVSSVNLGEFISGNPINNYNPSQTRAQFVFKKPVNERMLLLEDNSVVKPAKKKSKKLLTEEIENKNVPEDENIDFFS